MVKVCPQNYPKDNEEIYKEYFGMFPYPLSDFQKWSIQAIVDGNHSLVCCPTGNGKTTPAEFAINFFTSKKKKVLYCSPIKSLSNQKFNDFSEKYTHLTVGLLTGDIKLNPEADVIILTTEILLNKLYQVNSDSKITSNVSFEMDINTELGCVIFDEIHMIGDESRGHVWENSIMLLPRHIQMVMLSATLNDPAKFALWCETRGDKISNSNSIEKSVWLSSTSNRVVPLTHYSFITTNSSIFKIIKKDKELQEEIKSVIDKPFVIQDSKGVFNESHYFRMNKILKLFESKNVNVKRSHVLNRVCKHLVENNMLPALCFVLSRKQLEICAKEITTVLLEDDSKVPYIIRRECEQIIRKIPNYKEYLELPEYLNMVSLLEKGIAIHHSGVTPILREMVEILYAKGYVKILFGTETFSIGLNMPTKTVIFTDVNKFDGNNFRLLYAHEMTQMAGRAGRRNIDTVGNVIHLNNLFKNVDLTNYKIMMNGKPQSIISKFKISYNLLLNLIAIGDQNFTQFAKKSMVQEDITIELGNIYKNISNVAKELDVLNMSIHNLRTPKNIVDEYIDLLDKKKTSVNKKRKEIEKRIEIIINDNKFINTDIKTVEKYNEKQSTLQEYEKEYKLTEDFLSNNVNIIINFLEKDKYIEKNEENKYNLTFKGLISAQIREIHCLVFSKLIEQKIFEKITTKQLVGIFSCFTNVVVPEDVRALVPYSSDKRVQETIIQIRDLYQTFQKIEEENDINTGTDYNIHYDLIPYVMEWCDCEDVQSCKYLLQKLEKEKEVFLGEFVKALLKINNISSEMENIAEKIGAIEFLSNLKEIPNLTLKYVATNQSLYV